MPIAEQSPIARATALGLATMGAVVWIGVGPGRGIGSIRWMLVVAAMIVGLAPPVARAVARVLEAIRAPSPGTVKRATLCIVLGSAAYFALTAFNQGRDLFPKTNDDCSYLISMQMLARGRLWMEPLPAADFFDSFYILTRPVYASIYFPGTALLYVPTIWLHLPTWLMPALAAGAVVGATYRLVTWMIDGASGAMAAFLVAASSWFRVYSILLTSHVAMLLLGLLAIGAWLQWRRTARWRWAAALGALLGWAAITRPADSVVFAIPLGVATAVELIRRRDRSIRLAPLVMAAAAIPFLALQIMFDIGVTGRVAGTPYAFYLEQDQPGSGFGFHDFQPDARPRSALLQKQENYNWLRQYLRGHRPGAIASTWGGKNIPMICDVTMPCRLLLVPLPAGVLAVRSRWRWVLASTLFLFMYVYLFNPVFLEHYAILVIPSVALLTLLGINVLSGVWPSRKPQIASAMLCAIFVGAVTGFWEINQVVKTSGTEVNDETFPSPYLRLVHESLERFVDKPAVVLFTFHSGDSSTEEPVYNTDVAWPLDAPVIHVHDLGPERNREIFHYFARAQPQRTFYLFDWAKVRAGGDPLQRLGKPADLP